MLRRRSHLIFVYSSDGFDTVTQPIFVWGQGGWCFMLGKSSCQERYSEALTLWEFGCMGCRNQYSQRSETSGHFREVLLLVDTIWRKNIWNMRVACPIVLKSWDSSKVPSVFSWFSLFISVLNGYNDLLKFSHVFTVSWFDVLEQLLLLSVILLSRGTNTSTLHKTNICTLTVPWKMIFLFHRWDMLVPSRVYIKELFLLVD